MLLGTTSSLCLYAGKLDHLGPLRGFFGDELAKVGGREREHVATQVGKPRLHRGIGEASVDLLVELHDDRELSDRILAACRARLNRD